MTHQAKKIIIGLVGEMGSGKSTVARYITETRQASHYRFSDFLREILEKLYISPTRTNLIDLFLVLAKQFGEDVLARPMKELITKNSNNLVVVEGIRRPADISLLKELPNFYLVGITSQKEIRYSRITARREKSDDSTKTYEAFREDERRPTEILIAEMIKTADYIINNNGTVEKLHTEIENLISNIKDKQYE